MSRLIDIGILNLDSDLRKVIKEDDFVLFEREKKFNSTHFNNKVLLAQWLNSSVDSNLQFDYNMIVKDELLYLLYEREKRKPFSLSRFNNKLVSYIFNLASNLNKNNIKELIFNTTPHNFYTYLLYKVAIESNIGVVWCNSGLMCSRYSITKSFLDKQDYILPEKNIKRFSEKETEWLKSRSSEYRLPDYEQKRKNQMLGTYYNLRIDLMKWYKRIDLVYWKFKIYKKYKKITEKFVLPKSYILFPLHYQPERTTLPEGGIFHNQIYALKLLLKSLPKNMVVVAKEHPSTFSNMCHWKYRWPEYYFEDKNLIWAPINLESGNLIKKSKIVASINGSVCFEALLLKKKVVFFADNIFKLFPNVHLYSNIKNLNIFLSDSKFKENSYQKTIESTLHQANGYSNNAEIYKSFYLNYLKAPL